MPAETLLAVRPCGHAAALVRPDCSETANFRARWAGEGATVVAVPSPDAVARLLADHRAHQTCQAGPQQARMFSEAA